MGKFDQGPFTERWERSYIPLDEKQVLALLLKYRDSEIVQAAVCDFMAQERNQAKARAKEQIGKLE